MAKNEVNYIFLMELLSKKHDDWNEKNAISDRETDIIFDVFQIHAWISKLSFSENHEIYRANMSWKSWKNN